MFYYFCLWLLSTMRHLNEKKLICQATKLGWIQRCSNPTLRQKYFIFIWTPVIYEPHHEKTCLCHMRTTKVQIMRSLISTFIVRCLDSISSFFIGNFMPLTSFYSCAGRFESYLLANPKDRFSRNEVYILNCWSLWWAMLLRKWQHDFFLLSQNSCEFTHLYSCFSYTNFTFFFNFSCTK